MRDKEVSLKQRGTWSCLPEGDRKRRAQMIHRQLDKCGEAPNCVSSRNVDGMHRIDPIVFEGDEREACQRLEQVLLAMEGCRIVVLDADCIRAEFTSKLLGFVDDVMFYIDEPAGRIYVHSESRTGYYDFGVNRRRVEEIRRRFMALRAQRSDS